MKNFTLLFLLTIYGFTYAQSSNKYAYKAVQVKKATLKLNGSLNGFAGGKSMALVEVYLPANTIEWYFSFSTRRDRQAEKQMETAIDLTAKVSNLILAVSTSGASTALNGLTETAIKSITIPLGEVPVNVFAFDVVNANLFKQKHHATPIMGGYNESQVNGSSLIRDVNKKLYYIAIDNPNIRSGALVDIEVTALVRDLQSDTLSETHLPNVAVTPTNIIGLWKDENSTFSIWANKTITVTWRNGQIATGTWELSDNNLVLDFSKNPANAIRMKIIYQVIDISLNQFTLKAMNVPNEKIFTAIRVQ